MCMGRGSDSGSGSGSGGGGGGGGFVAVLLCSVCDGIIFFTCIYL